MPKWLKITLIVVCVMFALLVTAGVLGVSAMKRYYKQMERTTKDAQSDGKIFGMTASAEECVDEAVDRSGRCEGAVFSCSMLVHSFLYGCMEQASHDATYCKGVPRSGQDARVARWARDVCGARGQDQNQACLMGVMPATIVCWHNRL